MRELRPHIGARRPASLTALTLLAVVSASAAPQTISFTVPANQMFGTGPVPLAARSTSGLPITFTSNTPVVCRVAGGMATILAVGQCSLTASQAGNADFIAAASLSQTFTVTRAKPAGTLEPGPGSPFPTGTGPVSIASADFNQDGIPDLAVVDQIDGDVTVLLGNVNGTLIRVSGSPFPVGALPHSIVAGDFNGDGIADLATANLVGNNVTILLGRGDGAFTPASGSPVSLGTNSALPFSMAAGDFNRDGIQDLAVAESGTNAVAVLLGQGDGRFLPSAGRIGTGGPAVSVAVADFNGDGIPDLVTANGSSETVSVLLGDGMGGFAFSPGGSSFPVAGLPQVVVAGDFNNDGYFDLAVAGSEDDDVSILTGRPASTTSLLSTTTPLSIAAGQSIPLSVTVAPRGQALATPSGGVLFFDGNAVLGRASENFSPYSWTAINLAPGTHTISASYSGDATTLPSTSNVLTVQVTGDLALQNIAFDPIASQLLRASPVALSATATSGLAVTFASNTPSLCTVSGTSLTLVAAGSCSVTASQTGNGVYAAATPVTRTFTVASGSLAPVITDAGVVPVYSSVNTIQPGSWISIFGANLASNASVWNADFPKQLGNTSVTIDGQSAYLWYIGPNQINAQAPDDTKTGPVEVTVTTPNGTATSTVTLASVAPSFSLLGSSRYVAGIIYRSDGSGAYGGGTYDILGPAGNSLGYPTVPAKAGDIVSLFGVGFGPLVNPVPAGQMFSGADATANPVTVTIDNVSVTPSFAGLSEVGLYQLNLTIPAGLGSGDVPVAATVLGATTPPQDLIPLQ